MLILSRKKGQSIVIGNEITISVKEIRGNTVRLCVSSPRSLPVYREEILREIETENRRAADAAIKGKNVGDAFNIVLEKESSKEEP